MTSKPSARCGNGAGDAVTVARRMITGLEKQAGRLRGSAWELAGKNYPGSGGRGQERLLRGVGRRAETLGNMVWGKWTGLQKPLNLTTQSTQNQGAG